MTYTKDKLIELDKTTKMIPLYYDKMFKTLMMKNKELFKKFLIDTLRLNIDYNDCNITFLDKELFKELSKEHGKIIDINVKLNDKYVIDVEMNINYDEEIMTKSSLYLDKLRTTMVEINDKYSNILNYSLYQLNLNRNSNIYTSGENIIVSYDITTNTIFKDNKKVYIKNLDYYNYLYYNLNRNLSFDEIFMVALTAKTFTELDDILSKILKKNDKNRFLESVINMSTDSFILHEWEKDKLDKWEQEHRENRIKKDSKEEGIKEGKNIGIEEGLEEKTLEIIKIMLKKKMPYKDISDICNKSITEIKEIEKSMNNR